MAAALPTFWLLQHSVLQEQALSLLRTCTNVIARLPALEDPAAYSTLAAAAALPSLPQQLLSKQLVALDELIVQLQECMDGMQVRWGRGAEDAPLPLQL